MKTLTKMLAILAMAAITLSSCGGSDDGSPSSPEELLAGDWQMKTVAVHTTWEHPNLDSPRNFNCSSSRANGNPPTGRITFDQSKAGNLLLVATCVENDTWEFTWAINSDISQITLSTNEVGEVSWQIQSLTPNELIVRWTDVEINGTSTWTHDIEVVFEK